MRLADLVNEERERRNWSQRKLAKEAKVSAATVSRLESGERSGEAKTVAKITHTLGMDPAVVERALREQQEEERETQYSDLSRIPVERRPLTRLLIADIVRRMEEKE